MTYKASAKSEENSGLASIRRDVAIQAGMMMDQGWQCPWEAGRYCFNCGYPVGPYETLSASGCKHCEGHKHPWQRLYRLDMYQTPVSYWLHQMKYAGEWTWAHWLGRELARHYQLVSIEESVHKTLVSFVPMFWRRQWRRGYNQAELIAGAFARSLGLSCGPLLFRKRGSKKQVQRKGQDRYHLSGRVLKPAPLDLSDYRVILVDDVMTTGTTLRACTRLLERMGCSHVEVAVVAISQNQQLK